MLEAHSAQRSELRSHPNKVWSTNSGNGFPAPGKTPAKSAGVGPLGSPPSSAPSVTTGAGIRGGVPYELVSLWILHAGDGVLLPCEGDLLLLLLLFLMLLSSFFWRISLLKMRRMRCNRPEHPGGRCSGSPQRHRVQPLRRGCTAVPLCLARGLEALPLKIVALSCSRCLNRMRPKKDSESLNLDE